MSKAGKTPPIHVAKIEGNRLLVLRKAGEEHFVWHERSSSGVEKETCVQGESATEALRLAPREWKNRSFRTVICGFRFTLPERDEHGMNALFHQMVTSYQSSTGVYFDEEIGHNCIVKNASTEALDLIKVLT